MSVKTYKAETYTAEDFQKVNKTKSILDISQNDVFGNKIYVDTAGFVPLEVRIKKMILAGEQAKFSAEMFDSSDWEYMYSDVPSTSVSISDEVEELQTKLQMVQARQREILERKGYIKPVQPIDTSETSTEKGAKNDTSQEVESVAKTE